MQTQILIGIAAILGFVFILWCYYSAQELDENFKPLKPCKTLKDLWNDIVNWFEGLNDHLALGLLILGFSILVWLVNTIIFKIQ
jgi:hypothetical protein